MKGTMLLAIAMLAGTLAFAQDTAPAPPPPPDGHHMMMRMPGGRGMMGGWWKNSDIAQQLNLTDQQKQQLEKTFTDYRLQLIDQRAAVEREETKLEPLMNADQIDRAKVSAQLDTLIAARTRLEKTSAMMHVSMREILTPEQWKQLQTIHSQHRGRGMGMGMGEGRGMRFKQRQPPNAPGTPGAPPPPGESEQE